MAGGNKSVAEMKPGEIGIVAGFSDDHLSVKLMEMGCLPGSSVRFNFTAPFFRDFINTFDVAIFFENLK